MEGRSKSVLCSALELCLGLLKYCFVFLLFFFFYFVSQSVAQNLIFVKCTIPSTVANSTVVMSASKITHS